MRVGSRAAALEFTIHHSLRLLFTKYDLEVAKITTLASAISFFAFTAILKYSVEVMILKKAIQVANNSAMDFKPNIILAQGYGAKVALKMNKPRVPLILMSPIVYERFVPTLCIMKTRYAEFPFVLILHGYKDAHNPIINSVRLSSYFDRNRVKLDVLECDNHFSSLTPEVLRGWLEEAYQKGKNAVDELAYAGCDYVNKSLFESQTSV